MKPYHVFGIINIKGIPYTATCIPQEAFDTLMGAKAYAQYWSKTKTNPKVNVVVEHYDEKTNSFKEVLTL